MDGLCRDIVLELVFACDCFVYCLGKIVSKVADLGG